MSSAVNDFHWLIWTISVLAFILLLTPWRRYGATWIALLFLVQIIFRGCPITDLYNYFRLQEGLSPGPNGLLTAQLSSSFLIQMLLSVFMVLAALAIIILDKPSLRGIHKKGNERIGA